MRKRSSLHRILFLMPSVGNREAIILAQNHSQRLTTYGCAYGTQQQHPSIEDSRAQSFLLQITLSVLRKRTRVPGELPCHQRLSQLGHRNRFPSSLHAKSSLQRPSPTHSPQKPSVTSRPLASPALAHCRKPFASLLHTNVLASQPNDERSRHSHVYFATLQLRTNRIPRTCMISMQDHTKQGRGTEMPCSSCG
jgi:hypothetical protein